MLGRTRPQRWRVAPAGVASPLLWGSCQVSSALRCFWLWRVCGGGCCRSPRTPAAASGAGSGSAEPPATGFVFVFGSVSSSSAGELFSPRAICYPQAHQQRIGAGIMTYSGREEERAPSIYRSSSLVALSGDVEGAPFQRVIPRSLESFSFLGEVPPWQVGFS